MYMFLISFIHSIFSLISLIIFSSLIILRNQRSPKFIISKINCYLYLIFIKLNTISKFKKTEHYRGEREEVVVRVLVGTIYYIVTKYLVVKKKKKKPEYSFKVTTDNLYF